MLWSWELYFGLEKNITFMLEITLLTPLTECTSKLTSLHDYITNVHTKCTVLSLYMTFWPKIKAKVGKQWPVCLQITAVLPHMVSPYLALCPYIFSICYMSSQSALSSITASSSSNVWTVLKSCLPCSTGMRHALVWCHLSRPLKHWVIWSFTCQNLVCCFSSFLAYHNVCSPCTDIPPPSGKIRRGDVCKSASLIVFQYTFA